jgi:DNA polymerase III subunit gamma/tau
VALALYRKYRPRTFAEVIGQEHVTEPLTQALRSGRLNHAYLFSGPRGCGKTSSARILARSLNCEKGPTPEPCGVCDSCVALAPDGSGSIDVIEIDAASHGGVDDARELRERAFFAPVSSRFKVYVIDEAHMVSSAGFNALLKLVEEPPEYVKFVFATTEPEKVLGTIKSRTHHYPFRLIPPGTLRPYLERLCEREGVHVEPPVFPLIVRAGGGSARDSLSVLDQLIAGAGPEGVTYSRAVGLLGVTDAALLDEMCDALAATDGSAAYATIDRVMEAGHDPRRFGSDLLERLRDLIVLQQVRDAAAKGLLDYPADQLERLTAQAGRLGLATLTRCAGLVHDGLTEMRGTTAPRLLLELIVARMLLPGADESTGALLQRMERLERRLGAASEGGSAQGEIGRPGHSSPASEAQPVQTPQASPAAGPQPGGRPAAPAPAAHPPQPAAPESRPAGGSSRSAASPPTAATTSGHPAATPAVQSPTPVTRPAAPVKPVQAAPAQAAPAQAAPVQTAPAQAAPEAATAPTGALDAAAIRRVWDEVLTAVRRKSVREWAVAREATVRDVEGNTLVLLFQHQVHASMLSGNPKTLTDAVGDLLGGRWEVRCEIAGATPPPAQAQAAPPAPVADRAPTQRPPRSADEEEWPTAATPGGAGFQPGPPDRGGQAGLAGAPSAQGGTPPASASFGGAGSVPAGGAGPGPAGSAATASTGSMASARPGRSAATATAVKAPPVVQPAQSKPTWDEEPPPYETEYGFDPGDEPMDDEQPAVRESSEEQALRLLKEHLGAERID